MRYMLDTNIIAYAKNARPDQVLKKFQAYAPSDLCISAITMGELEYGVCKSSRPDQNRLALLTFLSGIEIVPFDANAAREYGLIRFDLKRRGEPIGANDLLIAAHAKALGLTLITNNSRELHKVGGLSVENWV